MDDDDRDHLVTLSEALIGTALRRHEWPWLRDDDGEPIAVDAFWPDLGIALGLPTEPFGPWRMTGAMLRLRGIRLLIVPPAALPWGGDGRLVRDDRRLLEILAECELPREDWEDPDDGRPKRLGDHDPPATVDLNESDWVTWTRNGRPLSWDDEGDDAFEDWPEPSVPGLAASWRGESVLLAALGAVALARGLLADETRGDLSAPQLQVLATLVAADHAGAAGVIDGQQDTPAALADRLGLGVEVVRGTVRSLVDADLVTLHAGEPSTVTPTAAGRRAVDEWITRIAPRFGRWPPRIAEADDAG